jgi:hypothetical protein
MGHEFVRPWIAAARLCLLVRSGAGHVVPAGCAKRRADGKNRRRVADPNRRISLHPVSICFSATADVQLLVEHLVELMLLRVERRKPALFDLIGGGVGRKTPAVGWAWPTGAGGTVGGITVPPSWAKALVETIALAKASMTRNLRMTLLVDQGARARPLQLGRARLLRLESSKRAGAPPLNTRLWLVGAGEIDAAHEPPQRWPDQTLKSNLLELAATMAMLNRCRMRPLCACCERQRCKDACW